VKGAATGRTRLQIDGQIIQKLGKYSSRSRCWRVVESLALDSNVGSEAEFMTRFKQAGCRGGIKVDEECAKCGR